MALNPQSLQSALQSLGSNPPASTADAGQKWADAYFQYALAAQALDATPVALAATTSSPLAVQFTAAMTAQTFLQQLPLILTAFWLTPPVLFVGVNNGPASVVLGTPALATAIAAMTAINTTGAGGSTPLATLVTAIDAFTRTVTVTLVNPSGVTIPTPLL